MESRFGESPLDREFRREMKKLVDSAEKEILVITGEVGSFENYQDLRWAIQRAVKRGVRIRVFAISPRKATINKMLSAGCEVYIGKEDLKDHYTVIDKRVVVESREHPRGKLGVRHGIGYENPKKAKEIAKRFDSYAKRAKRAKVEESEDPVVKLLEKPLDIGFSTDSRKIDQYI